MKTDYLCNGIIPTTKSRVRCVCCCIFISDSNKCIEEHTEGTQHKNNIQLMKENALSYIYNSGVFCSICKDAIPGNESITQHVKCSLHIKRMEELDNLIDGEFINISEFLAGKSLYAQCKPCSVYISCTLETIADHIKNTSHNENLAESIKPLNGLFPAINKNRLWCKICNQYINDSLTHVLAHAEFDEQHVSWFTKMERYTDENDIDLTSYLSEEYENKVYCTKCRCEILATPESINHHIYTAEHMTTQLPYIVEGNPQSLFCHNEMPEKSNA